MEVDDVWNCDDLSPGEALRRWRDVYEISDPEHATGVLRSQQNSEWCDITIFGKNTTENSASSTGIKTHKSILAAVSPYFHEAFKSQGFIDSNAKTHNVDQIDHETLQIIVNFIYTGQLRAAGDDCKDVLRAVLIGADYLLMPKLVRLCGEGLYSRFSAFDCAVEMWLFARKYHCTVLEAAAARGISLDLESYIAQTAYLNLNKGDVIELLKAMETNAVDLTANADLMCEAAIAWLGFDGAERSEDCDEVMRQVPLKSMSASGLKRASGTEFLSEHTLWAITQVYEVRAEVGNNVSRYQFFAPSPIPARFPNNLTDDDDAVEFRRPISSFEEGWGDDG